MTETMLHVNGVELCAETFGDPADPAVLLIDGAAASMLWWDAALCERIAAGGRFVIRYDQRDTGRSTACPPGEPDYSSTDLARDALGVLDAFGVDRAHVVCRSMSGGIGLILGVDHPRRVATLTFVSTSTGADGLPPPAVRHPAPTGDAVADTVAVVRAYAGGSPYFDEAATLDLARRDAARAKDIATAANHYAMRFDPPAGGGFGELRVPALVVHGDMDPLLPLPHGTAVRDAVPGARLVVLPGAGHDLPPQLWDRFTTELLRHTGNHPAGRDVTPS
ncbi:alpha/beta fold hydrolase [Dactylosporangium aurantiacum]|uniref:Alpha/beta fold hydrolase n=1 Tax=Dactylosporangium aurantiacum TaxID=35754 RepID=A0A9Q9MD26_9ACTN|nr:alpha/beta fold hydrolase [Dactylosporangium aurantiacum]MDG6105080.1 alpha/beta fold hydrolase [Dactylosporangium aurantiacum]UWZ51609.1 alpha/beta fold hydrolase [Dactylosporangium aurantiacum]